MMTTVPVTIEVLGQKVPCGATRGATRFWLLSAARFPEIRVSGLDLPKLKVQLARKLEPEVRRLQRQAHI